MTVLVSMFDSSFDVLVLVVDAFLLVRQTKGCLGGMSHPSSKIVLVQYFFENSSRSVLFHYFRSELRRKKARSWSEKDMEKKQDLPVFSIFSQKIQTRITILIKIMNSIYTRIFALLIAANTSGLTSAIRRTQSAPFSVGDDGTAQKVPYENQCNEAEITIGYLRSVTAPTGTGHPLSAFYTGRKFLENCEGALSEKNQADLCDEVNRIRPLVSERIILPSIPQCAGSISAQQLQHANTWPRRTLQHANTWPRRTLQHANTWPRRSLQHANTSPLDYQRSKTAPFSTAEPLDYRHANTSPLDYQRSKTAPFSTAEPLDYRHANTSPLDYGRSQSAPFSTPADDVCIPSGTYVGNGSNCDKCCGEGYCIVHYTRPGGCPSGYDICLGYYCN
jgi:hypothetical protein